MTPRRILLLNTDLERGGTPTVVCELATRLASAKVQVEVACLGRRGPLADPIEAAGLTVTALGAAGPGDLHVITSLSRLIREGDFDTVVSFLMHANAAAAAVSIFHPAVTFFQAIQTTQSYPAWHWPVQAAVQFRSRRVIVPSESVADCARTRALVPAERIVVIPNGVDLARFTALASLPVPGRFRLGFIGRLDPVKHVPDLVRAMSQVGPSITLAIFGDGSDRPRIERAIDLAGSGPRVTLCGMVPRPEVALSQIDALVLPSEAEGFPMVLIEAMAAGIPIIATDAPGIRDVVENEVTALLSPVSDSEALAASIRRLVADCSLRQRLAIEARQAVERRFTWDRVMAQYRQLLQV